MNEATPFSGSQEADDLKDLFENAPCGYLSTLPNGRISKVNRTFSTWTGFTSEQLIGRRFLDLLNIAGKIYYETHFAPMLRMQGSFDEVALDLVRADGTTLSVLVNAVARRDETGAIRFIRVTVFNASDRRRYERELLEARRTAEQAGVALRNLNANLAVRVAERARALDRAWRLSRDLLVIARADGVLAQVNDAWTELLGWQTSDLVGQNFVSFTHPDDLEATGIHPSRWTLIVLTHEVFADAQNPSSLRAGVPATDRRLGSRRSRSRRPCSRVRAVPPSHPKLGCRGRSTGRSPRGEACRR